MLKKSLTRYRLFITLLVLYIASGCNRNETTDEDRMKLELYDLMKEVYLWNTKLPSGFDPLAYSSPETAMEAMRYGTFDRWSFVMPLEEYYQYFEQGEMIGHGFMLALDESENIRIAFVYPDTRAYESGIRRSWIISKVNGTNATPDNVFSLMGETREGVRNTFTFLKTGGETTELTLEKEIVSISPVLHRSVFSIGTQQVGYLVFQDYIDAAKEQLDEAFSYFNRENINQLVIDLRYNGGGSVAVAQYLAGWILGNSHAGDPFVNFEHNTKYTRWDTTLNIPVRAEGLALPKVYFIATGNSASASELTINGVEPYAEACLVGGTTHGKPVGMYVFTYPQYGYAAMPVCFRYTNADGSGDFYEGLSPDLPVGDDLAHDFGDPEEGCLNAVLNEIEGVAVPYAYPPAGAPAIEIIASGRKNPFQQAF